MKESSFFRNYKRKIAHKSILISILFACVFFTCIGVGTVSAKNADENSKTYEDIVFEGNADEQLELERLLMAKLTYSYLDGYEGLSVSEYVRDNPEEYSAEIWENSGITYEALYSSVIGDWEIYAVYNKNKDTGFYAVAYRKANEVVYTFRGSEMFTDEFALDESNDWTGTDFKFALLNKLSGQFDNADECLKNLRSRLKNDKIDAHITLAGHSLGGALVTYEALVSGLEGYSYDGAAGHVIDLVYFYRYLDIYFEGIESQPFVNYTDETGYPVADIIQHTNSNAMYQIDRETTLKNLEEYTFIPKYSTGGSHIAWSTVGHDENKIYMTVKQDEDGDGFTYIPQAPLCLDIKQNIIEMVVNDFPDLKPDYECMAGAIAGVIKDGRVMLASKEGSVLRAYDDIGVNSAFDVSTVMYGGVGDDELYGYISNDVLLPGTGNDLADGGLGDDTYIIDPNSDGKLLIRDQDSAHSTIVLRGFNYIDNEKLDITDTGISVSDLNQIIELELMPGQMVDIYAYDDNRFRLITTYTVSGKLSKDNIYVVFLEGKGDISLYNDENIVWTENNYEEQGIADELVSREVMKEGVAYISREEGKESILLILDSDYDIRVSSYKERVNMALAQYNNSEGVIATERKYKRKFENYKIYFTDTMLDDGPAGDTSWEDVFDAGLSMLLK